MIAAGMLYSILVAIMLGWAAIAAERLLLILRWPTRHVWILTILSSAALMAFAFLKPGYDAALSAEISLWSISVAPQVHDVRDAVSLSSYLPVAATTLLAWPQWPQLDSVLIALWVGSSLAVFGFMVVVWRRFDRLARDLPLAELDGKSVRVTEQVGPAVFGCFRPIVLVPRWLLNASESVHSIVLAHEQSHVVARDPLLLMAARMIVAFAPWSVPMWWQIRRLRFAVEVDCDRRVLKNGLDPVTYGKALLTVGQQRSQVPLGAIALTEPTSQLEQRIRIMMRRTPQHASLLVGGLLVLSSAFVVGAAQLEAPVKMAAPTDLQKSPPTEDGSLQLGRKFEVILREKYPQLLTRKTEGTPVVSLLFGADGTVERSSTEVLAGSPDTFRPTEESYAKTFGIQPEQVAYVGLQGVQTPAGDQMLVAFTERKTPGQPFASTLLMAPDTSDIDRKIAEQNFAKELRNGVSSRERLWALFDNEGRLLKTGITSAGDEPIHSVVKVQFPGIDTEYVTATAITDARGGIVKTTDGKPLQLLSIWLKKGSQSPVL